MYPYTTKRESALVTSNANLIHRAKDMRFITPRKQHVWYKDHRIMFGGALCRELNEACESLRLELETS